MTLTEIILIGIALAMDAVAVSMTNSMVYRNVSLKEYIAMVFCFSGFQAFMPLIGNFTGAIFAEFIYKYAGIVIFLILGIIGFKMIKEGFGHSNKHSEIIGGKRFTLGILVFQAIATSLDAFGVGIGFSVMQVNIVTSVTIIALVTAILTMIAIIIGRKFGDILGSRAEILGGLILVIIGVKAVIK